jgi:hypothetical protein
MLHSRPRARQHWEITMGREDERKQQPDGGAYIGNRPEFAEETIPGGVREGDERVAANDSESSGEGKASERAQGDPSDWPHGHREADAPPER